MNLPELQAIEQRMLGPTEDTCSQLSDIHALIAEVRRLHGWDEAEPFPLPLDVEIFREAWGRWVQYRRERKKTLTPTTRAFQLKKLKEHSPAEAVAMLDQSMTNGWIGIFPVKKEGDHGPQNTRPGNGAGQRFQEDIPAQGNSGS